MTCPMCLKWSAEPHLRIAEFDQTYVMLNADQFFRGYTFVFAKDHVTELFHLDAGRRSAVVEEVSFVAHALHAAFSPAKINYELLGNMVPHMHWHIVPRFTEDPLWPRPIWAEPHEERLLSADDCASRIALIRSHLTTEGEYR